MNNVTTLYEFAVTRGCGSWGVMVVVLQRVVLGGKKSEGERGMRRENRGDKKWRCNRAVEGTE